MKRLKQLVWTLGFLDCGRGVDGQGTLHTHFGISSQGSYHTCPYARTVPRTKLQQPTYEHLSRMNPVLRPGM